MVAFTNKQRVFISEYLRDFNATRAAIRAGYSAKTAYAIGQENLKKPDIAEAIRNEISTRAMGADEVLLRTADMARGDIADLMDITPSGYTFKLIVDDGDGNKIVNPKTKLIRKIRQKVTTYLAKSESGEDREVIETELELYSAQEALRDVAKYLRMVTDRQENMNIDLAGLTDEQLELLANGASIFDVLAGKSKGDPGTSTEEAPE